ncbi:hypothetical protein RGQ29_017650 [Quercus rubra]|uniref:Transposase n=1 Tax=Quercus rubra TaxID=3512 RepID=A0AAN7FM70_QUERU|nr:hypothetical protein RGQ29_017650 [Quercus rubra]
MLEPSSFNNNPTFKGMFNYVHIDEKWFYMSKESEKYYLLPQEQEPLRTCKSKRFIAKVMVLAAVACPRFDSSRNQQFDGKIGIFPFTCKEPAKRSSKNRVAANKWPRDTEDIVFIQQDNAGPHIDPNDAEFLEAASSDGFKIHLSYQPPNSPDMNVLDLGFFRAIQSLQQQEALSTVDELVNAIEKAFNELPPQTLNRVFLGLPQCMIEVIKDFGGNNYKLSKKNWRSKVLFLFNLNVIVISLKELFFIYSRWC